MKANEVAGASINEVEELALIFKYVMWAIHNKTFDFLAEMYYGKTWGELNDHQQGYIDGKATMAHKSFTQWFGGLDQGMQGNMIRVACKMYAV